MIKSQRLLRSFEQDNLCVELEEALNDALPPLFIVANPFMAELELYSD